MCFINLRSVADTINILGLDHKISNQRKIVTEGDKSSVVNNPTGRKRPAEK
ncbi:stationary-phase-induced ribosome-associated protein [Escherichia coli]|nr:stationary-phase-induced ribosome-associated protein [Escherichia coli]RDY33622.1 stationary-phase-induced ribosome-associated protein [Escherichia coli]